MTKKIIIIALAFILCLSVIGGCFALYVKNATELNIQFGSEGAVTLTLNPGTLTFGGVKLNPSEGHRSASQAITLDVTTNDKESLKGMSGVLTVSVTGALANSLDLSAVADTVNYTATQLTGGVTLALNALPKNFTLTLALKDEIDDDAFKAISTKTASVTVSWKVIEWAPIDGAYYIVGQHCGWELNKGAIRLDKDVTGSSDKAAIERVTLKANSQFKVVPCKNGDLDWDNQPWPQYNGSTPNLGANVAVTADGNLYVTADGDYFICINEWGNLWVAPAE